MLRRRLAEVPEHRQGSDCTYQRFLGHKRLNSTMVYARVHDRTVPQDYYRAMQQVEERLDADSSHAAPLPSELIALVDVLDSSTLSDAQRNALDALRDGIALLAR